MPVEEWRLINRWTDFDCKSDQTSGPVKRVTYEVKHLVEHSYGAGGHWVGRMLAAGITAIYCEILSSINTGRQPAICPHFVPTARRHNR